MLQRHFFQLGRSTTEEMCRKIININTLAHATHLRACVAAAVVRAHSTAAHIVTVDTIWRAAHDAREGRLRRRDAEAGRARGAAEAIRACAFCTIEVAAAPTRQLQRARHSITNHNMCCNLT